MQKEPLEKLAFARPLANVLVFSYTWDIKILATLSLLLS